MGLEDFLISTGVDGLINLVHKEGRIETEEAASRLEMPLSTVEDWAKTLEDEGLIRIEYKITKEYLVWASLSPQKYSEKKQEIGKNRQKAVEKLKNLKKSVDENLEELEKNEIEFEQKKVGVEEQLTTLSQDVREASELADEAKNIIDRKKQNLHELEIDFRRAQKELDDFEEVLRNSPAAREGENTNSKELMQKLESASQSLEKKVEQTSTTFEKITGKINSIKKDLENDTSHKQLQEVKKELEEVKFARNELVKSAKALLQEAKDMGMRQKELSQKVNAIESVRSDSADPKRLSAEVDAAYKKATKASKDVMYEMQNNLMVVRKQVQDYSQAAYKYQNLKTQIDSIQSRYTQESAQLSELLHKLDEAKAKYDTDLRQAQNSLGDKKEKFENLLNKVKQIDLMLSNIKELRIEGKKLSSKLKGLMREAQVVDMAAPEGVKGGAPVYMPAADAKRKLDRKTPVAAGAEQTIGDEVAQKITLTAQEEKEFEKKRQELRWLIHRMWEEDRTNQG